MKPTREKERQNNPYSLTDWLRLSQDSTHLHNRYMALSFWVIAGIGFMMVCAFAAEIVRWIGSSGILTLLLLPLALIGLYQVAKWWKRPR